MINIINFLFSHKKINSLIGLICIPYLLIGCAAKMPKEVKIPITIQASKPIIPNKPILPIATLKKNSKPDIVIKSYVASVKILEGYSDQLIKILKAY